MANLALEFGPLFDSQALCVCFHVLVREVRACFWLQKYFLPSSSEKKRSRAVEGAAPPPFPPPAPPPPPPPPPPPLPCVLGVGG
jgi:hypothetical protein